MSELRSVWVKGSVALYLGLLQEVCKTHLLDFPVHKSMSSEELFLLHLSALEYPLKVTVSGMWSVSLHTDSFFTGRFSWLQISKMPFLLLTSMPSLLTSQIT